MKKILLLALFAFLAGIVQAQRVMDRLDRGLVAVKSGSSVFLSWRIQAHEYYDVTYNVYKDGNKVADNLTVSNYVDASGLSTSKYSVSAVIKGVEQPACNPASVQTNSYREIKLTHQDIRSTLVPNDACCADVDGDGELEILLKFDNADEAGQSYPREGPTVGGVVTKEYSIFEVLKMDGKRLWWVNCGPNMGDFQNNEQNIVGYDWDQDGKAEVVMRLLEGSTIHYADGTTYTIGADGKNGTSWTNYRAATGGGTNWFMHDGKEFLVYCNGETGQIYDIIDFPLARLESGETDLNKAWGDGYGHRSNKFFFGAPYLDGRKPSIFLARGIYTRHKMAALDVNQGTHKLTQRWKWYNNTGGPWKGQGYHNYSIADVDMDGRDEIVFGSMVIDDNGKGLSTAGLGHGDAQHCGDLNPYEWGLEQFACNEDEQGFNYRNATTSKLYAATLHVGKDVGRAMAGNFTEEFPGGLGTAWGTISTVTNAEVSGLGATGVNSNMRIFWDGDLVSETFNGESNNDSPGVIAKYGSWTPIYKCEGSLTNNYTKATPCYQGDLFGDWREEIIMRTPGNNIRIYTTTIPTKWRNYSLWYDHQYRNAMVWQMCGYNQPPHPSYFLGELDGITMAPPPLTMTGRTEVKNGGSISSALNGSDVIVCETSNSAVTLESGAAPSQLIFNIPTWVQGSGSSECTTKEPKITYTTYTCTVTGGGMAGAGRLVKQGEGILILPSSEFSHTGATDVWGGTLAFNGSMKNSPLWLNRFTTLISNGGEFQSIKADYASTIRPGGAAKGNITTGSLTLGFGSRLEIDLFSEDLSADQMIIGDLTIETKTSKVWVNAGPTYLSPVLEVIGNMPTGEKKMQAGKYVIGKVTGTVTGDLSDIVIEGLAGTKMALSQEGQNLILEIFEQRDAAQVRWTGAQSTTWDLGESENFSIQSGSDVEATTFVSGDDVTFGDEAPVKTVNVVGSLIPTSMTVDNTATYTIQGDGGIDGTAKFIKKGTGTVTMKGNNLYTGGNTLSGGVTSVTTLSNSLQPTGNLGGVTTAGKFVIENGATLKSAAAVSNDSPITLKTTEGGVIENSGDFKQNGTVSGTLLTKKGNGSLFLLGSATGLTNLNLLAGGVAIGNGMQPKAINVQGTGVSIWDDGVNTTHTINVEQGKSATWNLTYTYYTAYANKLTGEGTLTIVPRNSVSRVRITGDWSQFYGTIKHNTNLWLPLDLSSTASHATLDVAAGCAAASVPGRTVSIGAVTGSGSLTNSACDYKSSASVSGNVTWSIGNSDGKDFTFAGAINNNSSSNTCSFTKVGTCKMTYTGESNYTGATNINAGTLELNAASKKQLGTGALTVKSGATLGGLTTFANSSITVNAGGTLRVGGEATVTGTVTFAQNVKVDGTYQIFISSAARHIKAVGIKTLTLNGTLKVLFKTLPTTEGTVVNLWSAEKTVIGSNLQLDIPSPGEGLTWDTSDLANGNIKVVSDPTGIEGISADKADENAYNLKGQKATSSDAIRIVGGKKIIK